jgi:hypothetical protein
MVFAAHGSGIGLQLRAAADLAAHLAAGGAPQAWTARFHKRFGGGACAAVVFARLSAQLRAADLAALFESGLTSPPLLLRGLLQEPMRPAPAALPGLVWRAARSPRATPRVPHASRAMPHAALRYSENWHQMLGCYLTRLKWEK